MPTAVIEVVDPILLSLKIAEPDCCCNNCCRLNEVPDAVCRCFDDDILLSDEGKKLYATIGQFAILRLERDIQLLIPAYDICMPCKECSSNEEDPCNLFEKFTFPVDEFFPPKYDGNLCGCGLASESTNNSCGCASNNNSNCGCNTNHNSNCGSNHNSNCVGGSTIKRC